MKTILFTLVSIFFSTSIFAQFTFWTLESELLQNTPTKASNVTVSDEYALLSAQFDDQNTGAIVLFRFIDEEWVEIGLIKASDGEPDDFFGFGCSIDGNQILIGAPTNNFGVPDYSKVYFFEINDGTVTETASFQPDLQVASGCGFLSDIEGDYAIVGAPDDEYGIGAAVMYKKGDNGWEEDQIIFPEPNYSTRSFGAGVSISGDWAAIGSYTFIPGGGVGYQQVIFMYKLIDDVWTFQQIIESGANDPITITPSWNVGHQDNSMIFGYRFAGNGTSDVVGGAEFYSLSADEWTSVQTLSDPDLDDNLFGRRTDLEGEFALVGYSKEPSIDYDSAHFIMVYQQASLDNWMEVGRFKMESSSHINFGGVDMDLSNSFAIMGDPNALGNLGRAYVLDLRGYTTTGTYSIPTFVECKLFPNPTVDRLHISTEKQLESVLIFDEVGRVVLKETAIQNSGLEIDVSAFSTGLYFVQILLESGKGEVHSIMVDRK